MRNAAMLLLLLLCAACTTVTRQPPPPPRPQVVQPPAGETQDAELRRIVEEAEPIIDNILYAINASDHAAYIRDFNDAMKSAYHDKRQFKKINKWRKSRIGENTAKNVWKIQKQNQYYIIYYWTKFTKAQNPVTIRMVLERNEETQALQVAMLSYDAPELKE